MTMGFVTDFFILGGSQSDEAQWMAFMERQNEALRPPDGRTRWWHFYRAFQGTGHLSSRSKHHVGFVAEVIAQIMEMSIFAYLGVFLFIDKHFWDLRLNFIAIFGCIASRVVMVMLFSFAINLFVWLDVERRVARCLFLDRPTLGRRESDDDFSVGSSMHVYLNGRTQRFLMLAGIRGAVSFALVENVPVYDAVRQTGSHFKGELKAMTSSSILFTVFIFGALTYFLVKEESSHRHSSAEHMLSRRLLSAPLGSEADDSDDRLTDMELNSDVGDEN
jgi:NhaP-type Na+/H+ or K+/H+ antiporter